MSELIKIPYVGRATEASLKLIGYNTLESLKGADPELMYKKESVIRKKVSIVVNYICTV